MATYLPTLRVGEFVIRPFTTHMDLAAPNSPELRIPIAPTREHVTIPTHMTPRLAQFLGMVAADGHTTESTGAVGLTTAKTTKWLPSSRHLPNTCLASQRGISRISANPSVQYLTLNSSHPRPLGGESCSQGRVRQARAAQVLAGSAEEKLAFLRGVSLDGYYDPKFGLYVYAGMSRELAYGVAEICRSFGLPLVRQHRGLVAASGKMSYKVLVSNELQGWSRASSRIQTARGMTPITRCSSTARWSSRRRCPPTTPATRRCVPSSRAAG